jgi:hypothetical protein
VLTADNLFLSTPVAFGGGSVQLVAVPVDYSENTRVLVEEPGA